MTAATEESLFFQQSGINGVLITAKMRIAAIARRGFAAAKS
jgi:hypothetical protein